MRQALLIALILLQGCASRGLRPLRPLQLATAQYQDLVTASLTGSLMYEGGCLLFREDKSNAHFVPVWPTGSTFNGTSVIFHEPAKADQRIIVGEEFLMEGRPMQWPEIFTPYYEPFQRQCGAQPFFVSSVRPAN